MKKNNLYIRVALLSIIFFLSIAFLGANCEREMDEEKITDSDFPSTDEYFEEDEGQIVNITPDNLVITITPENLITGEEFEIFIDFIDIEDLESEIDTLTCTLSLVDMKGTPSIMIKIDIDPFNSSPIKVSAPEKEGVYIFQLLIPEVPGGGLKIDWDIEFIRPEMELQNLVFGPILSESGTIVSSGDVNNFGSLNIGDTNYNSLMCPFISLDTSILAGITINSATAHLKWLSTFGDGNLQIENQILHLGAAITPTTDAIANKNYEIGPYPIAKVGWTDALMEPVEEFDKNIGEFLKDGSAVSTGEELANILQDSADLGLDRVILIIAPDNLISNDNDNADGFTLEAEIILEYIPLETVPTDSTQPENEARGGIGALLTLDDNNNIIVLEPLPESPALDAGIQAGDLIIAVDGSHIEGKDIDTVANMLMGPVDTKVVVTLVRSDQHKVFICTRTPLPEIEEDE